MTELEPDVLELEVGNVANGGFCVARHEGRVVFVRHALPGERVRARVTDRTKNFLRADAVEIIEASPDRVQAPCPFAGPAGAAAATGSTPRCPPSGPSRRPWWRNSSSGSPASPAR